MRNMGVLLIALVLATMPVPLFGQTAADVAGQTHPEAAESAMPKEGEDEEIAIYGEIQGVDSDGAKFTVQYYDYDSDSEKTSDVVVTKETSMENVAALSEIRKGDWVDVTYIVADGKNVARVVAVEKEEPTTESGADVFNSPDEE